MRLPASPLTNSNTYDSPTKGEEAPIFTNFATLCYVPNDDVAPVKTPLPPTLLVGHLKAPGVYVCGRSRKVISSCLETQTLRRKIAEVRILPPFPGVSRDAVRVELRRKTSEPLVRTRLLGITHTRTSLQFFFPRGFLLYIAS